MSGWPRRLLRSRPRPGFEDYSPYYTPQFAVYYGLVGSTMETTSKTEDGVDARCYGILAGAKYTASDPHRAR